MGWTAIDGITGTLSASGDAAKAISESEVVKQHTKIEQLDVDRRRAVVEPAHHRLSISTQCRLLQISRSSYYISGMAYAR